MSFLYPSFLWALTAMLIPVIIHLFSFRRHKTVYFSQTKFLESVKKDTKSKTTLKHILILITRMLLIAALVIAFARPVIVPENGLSESNNTEYVAVYIDNSYSMQNEGEKSSLIDIAKQKATEIATAYGEGIEYYLFTNDMPPRYYRPMAYDDFLKEVSSITVSPVNMSLSRVSERLKSVFSNENNELLLYFISDFQKSGMNFEDAVLPENIKLNAILIPSVQRENLSIDSVWFSSPYRQSGKPELLSVLINNHGEQAYTDIPIRLKINDSLRAVNSFNIGSKDQIEVILGFTNKNSGVQKLAVSIDDYPVSFDNVFYLDYKLQDKSQL